MSETQFEQGRASAKREFQADGWTAWTAQSYLQECAEADALNAQRYPGRGSLVEGRDDYDRGFMTEVKKLAGVL